MKIADKVRILREERGMTQEELAAAVGYKTRSSIAKIETGESDPPTKVLKKIAAVLEVSAAEFILDNNNNINTTPVPQTDEAKILCPGIDSMPPEERKKALQMIMVVYGKYFKKGNDDQ